ncbi:MAG: hypothetical protein AABZ33_10050 [Chloroflexota bacterium]
MAIRSLVAVAVVLGLVASRDVAGSLAGDFGDQALSPPSTPSIVIGPDGSLLEKHLGIRGSDGLVDLFEQHAA